MLMLMPDMMMHIITRPCSFFGDFNSAFLGNLKFLLDLFADDSLFLVCVCVRVRFVRHFSFYLCCKLSWRELIFSPHFAVDCPPLTMVGV